MANVIHRCHTHLTLLKCDIWKCYWKEEALKLTEAHISRTYHYILD